MQITGSLVIEPVYLHKCLLGSLAPPYLILWTPNLAALSLSLFLTFLLHYLKKDLLNCLFWVIVKLALRHTKAGIIQIPFLHS